MLASLGWQPFRTVFETHLKRMITSLVLCCWTARASMVSRNARNYTLPSPVPTTPAVPRGTSSRCDSAPRFCRVLSGHPAECDAYHPRNLWPNSPAMLNIRDNSRQQSAIEQIADAMNHHNSGNTNDSGEERYKRVAAKILDLDECIEMSLFRLLTSTTHVTYQRPLSNPSAIDVPSAVASKRRLSAQRRTSRPSGSSTRSGSAGIHSVRQCAASGRLA